jgi:hypothetical protein
MTMTYLPPTQEISALFALKARAMGCGEPEVYDDGARVFARAVRRHRIDIRARDPVRGGVALRVVGEWVDVHPFVLRQVCTNGAVMAQAIQSQRVRRVEVSAPSELITAALDDIRAAIQACGDPAAFADAVSMMQRAVRQPVGMTIDMFSMLDEMRRWDDAVSVEMFARFNREHDRSAFGLVNALTSIARDTPDPERRWRIEELGGRLLALIPADQREDELADAIA